MAILRNTAIVIACIATFYQIWLKSFVFDVLGVGRTIEPLDNFPWTCRRLTDDKLEGCEDMWLDSEGQVLYAACSGSVARGHWNPGLSKLNVSGRRLEGSKLVAIHIDESTDDGLFRMHSIEREGYEGATGDKLLDLVGFDVDKSVTGELRFWLINQRPAVGADKKLLDAPKVGANVTVDVFRYRKGSTHMSHLKTIVHPQVYSANNLALMGDESFVLTNDHSSKVGLRKELDMLIGGGNVVRCEKNGACVPLTTNFLRFANGLARDADGLVYVAFTAAPYIGVYRFIGKSKLEEVDRIRLGMPVDNLSVDSNGHIWAAGIPKMFALVDSIGDPFDKASPSTIFKIHKTSDNKYKAKKALEDGEAKLVSGATVAVFDSTTGRLFVEGAATPFVTVCESA